MTKILVVIFLLFSMVYGVFFILLTSLGGLHVLWNWGNSIVTFLLVGILFRAFLSSSFKVSFGLGLLNISLVFLLSQIKYSYFNVAWVIYGLNQIGLIVVLMKVSWIRLYAKFMVFIFVGLFLVPAMQLYLMQLYIAAFEFEAGINVKLLLTPVIHLGVFTMHWSTYIITCSIGFILTSEFYTSKHGTWARSSQML